MNEEEIMKIIYQNKDYQEIANYIISNFSIKLEINEALALAEKLVKEFDCKKEQILNGYEDKRIKHFLFLKSVRRDSVAEEREERKKVQLKTKKKQKNKKIIELSLASAIIISGTFYLGKNLVGKIKEKSLDNKVEDYIAVLSSTPYTEDYNKKISIVEQNKYVVDRNYDTGDAIIAYHYDDLAADILDICKKDPELFDIVINEVYFDLENRLENMDTLFGYLQRYTSKEEDLQSIYIKIKDCDVFLDYLITRGLVPTNSEDYNLLLNDINNYKNLKSNNNVAFSGLDKDAKKRIEDLIEKYKEQKKLLNTLYSGRLENLVDEQGEIYGR